MFTYVTADLCYVCFLHIAASFGKTNRARLLHSFIIEWFYPINQKITWTSTSCYTFNNEVQHVINNNNYFPKIKRVIWLYGSKRCNLSLALNTLGRHQLGIEHRTFFSNFFSHLGINIVLLTYSFYLLIRKLTAICCEVTFTQKTCRFVYMYWAYSSAVSSSVHETDNRVWENAWVFSVISPLF